LFIGLAFGAVSAMYVSLASTGALFLLSVPIMSIGGLTTPSLMAIASKHAGELEQGRLQGALSSLQGVSMMVAPPLLAQIFSVAVERGGRPYSGVPFAFASLVMCTALLLAVRATRLERAAAT
jgi:DHA1 family tetracycline resistance protein-like MFS transporter